MQKRVYTKDLELKEILQRLNKGEKLYYGNETSYFQKIDGFLIIFADNTPMEIQDSIILADRHNPKYFVDEVEEPEADESCVDKLCWFWNTDEQEKDKGASLLAYIDNGYFTYDGLKWNHCKALTKEEALDFIKE